MKLKNRLKVLLALGGLYLNVWICGYFWQFTPALGNSAKWWAFPLLASQVSTFISCAVIAINSTIAWSEETP